MSGIGIYEVQVVVIEKTHDQVYIMKFQSRKEITTNDIRKYFCTHYHEGTYEYKIVDPVYSVHEINLDTNP